MSAQGQNPDQTHSRPESRTDDNKGAAFTREAALRAKAAGLSLGWLSADARSALLRGIAKALGDEGVRAKLFDANARDVERARAEEARGTLASPLVKRLVLDPKKLESLIEGLNQLAAMGDEVGCATLRRELDDGLLLERVSCPLGLIGVVFESRPDALVQIAGLALRTGNAVLLKGGREALETNRALTAMLHAELGKVGLPAETCVLLEDRADVTSLLALDGVVDLIIARGSTAFVTHVQASTKIPVMGHAAGICHLYLHAAADPTMAAAIAVDAKCTYPAACNAIETLLWDRGAEAALDAAVAALVAAKVELRGDEATRARHPGMKAATAEDWDTEYGALILSIKQVANMDEALAHMAAHGSRHTEAIVTSDRNAAGRFLGVVDAACVFHNASNRFADGFRFGLGAEVGISTDKLHARGPVGVDGLYTYRWLLRGRGHVTASYGPGGRKFTHKDVLPPR